LYLIRLINSKIQFRYVLSFFNNIKIMIIIRYNKQPRNYEYLIKYIYFQTLDQIIFDQISNYKSF